MPTLLGFKTTREKMKKKKNKNCKKKAEKRNFISCDSVKQNKKKKFQYILVND